MTTHTISGGAGVTMTLGKVTCRCLADTKSGRPCMRKVTMIRHGDTLVNPGCHQHEKGAK